MDTFTTNIQGGSYTIKKSLGVFQAQVTAKGGSIFIIGNRAFFDGLPSQPIEILEGATWFSAANACSPLEITIDPNGNTAQLGIFL